MQFETTYEHDFKVVRMRDYSAGDENIYLENTIAKQCTNPNAKIALTALYQARAGGNRAMIANAEKYLVTNSDVTVKRRAPMQAPWQKDQTKSFLATPRSKPFPQEKQPTHSLRRTRGFQPTLAPCNIVNEIQHANKVKDKLSETLADRDVVNWVSQQTMKKELRRAELINSQTDRLNKDLLEVAKLAVKSVPDLPNTPVPDTPKTYSTLEEVAKSIK